MREFRKFLNTPLQLGNQTIKTRLILAPMSGLTHLVLRKIIMEQGGCGLLYTEMCLASLVIQEDKERSLVFKWEEQELPYLVCQILVREIDIAKRAAVRIQKEGFFGLDINMGCSVKRIVKKGMGAALLREPDRARALVKGIKAEVDIPVIVKLRTAWKDHIEETRDLARSLEEAGADALVFHPRTAPDIRTRSPKWEYIREIKHAVNIPVFGNGDVFHEEDMERILDTGCDGIALGRIAAARPWIFAQTLKDLTPKGDLLFQVGIKMLEGLHQYYPPDMASRLFKHWCRFFFANFVYGHSMLKTIGRCTTKEEIVKQLENMLLPPPPLKKRPNLNLLR